MWLDKLGEFNEWSKLGKWGEFGNEMIGMNLMHGGYWANKMKWVNG